MKEPFAKDARRAISRAREEAANTKVGYVGAEHLLIGIADTDGCRASELLAENGLSADNLREGISYEGQLSDSDSSLNFSKSVLIIFRQAFKILERFSLETINCSVFLLAVLESLESFHADQSDGEVVKEIFNSAGGKSLIDSLKNALIEDIKDSAESSKPEKEASEDKSASKKSTKTPELDKVSRDLTKLAAEGKLDPLIGRQSELERLIMILSKRRKCNPVLVGEPGVGKTIIVEGLAQRIVRGEVPDRLKGCRVCSMSIAGVVGGTKYRGMFEERMNKILKELSGSKSKIILFIDELHTLISAGDSEGGIDAANILKPALARGELQCIGATTSDEYNKYIEKDKALERRFQPIKVEAPDEEESVNIIFGIRAGYEKHHGVKISDEAVKEAVRLSERYITDRLLPDKAIDVIDETCSRVSLGLALMPIQIEDVKGRIASLKSKAEDAADKHRETELEELQSRIAAAESELEQLEKEWKDRQEGRAQKTEDACVTPEDIAYVVSLMCGVPISKISQTETERLINIEKILHERVVGQDEPVKVISRAVKRARGGFKNPSRPIGSFLLLGPTGVGKTELARTMAEFMFGDEKALIRLDMSEFSEKFNVSRLYGAAPGYVGYEEGGELTDAVRRRPYSVVLFDEIEKAHPDIFNVLLQILDEGRLTDSKRHVVDFKNTIIMMTSNIGFDHPDPSAGMGLRGRRDEGSAEERFKSMERRVLEDVKQSFKPEFLNRLDASVVFHSLETEHLIKIADIMLDKVRRAIKTSGRSFVLTERAEKALVLSCRDPQYGARPLRRAIQDMIEDPLSDCVLDGRFPENSTMQIDLDEEGIAKLAEYEAKQAEGRKTKSSDDELDFEFAFELLKSE